MPAADLPADSATLPAPRTLRPAHPGEGEAIVWEGRPDSRSRRLAEMLGLLAMLGLLVWLAVELIRPHFKGSAFAGEPTSGAIPLILMMVVGTVSIIALPVWLRTSARGRARYMLTNRRALIWVGNSILGEARLFGADMRLSQSSLSFVTPHLYLSWRLKDEGMDQLRFERIADAAAVAAMAEEHGARWIDRPDDPSGL